MAERMTEKKKQIILAAMKLFSLNGFNNTSMQEIAETCEMSKGSLYTYFKSKEELLLSMMQFFSQQIWDRIMLIQHEPKLTEKEKFSKQIEVHMQHFVEFREINMKQIFNSVGRSNENIANYIRNMNYEMLHWLEKRMIDMYGKELEPYKADCAMFFGGLFSTYFTLILMENIKIPVKKIISSFLRLLDYMVGGILATKPDPLLTPETWPNYAGGLCGNNYEKDHPLVLIKQMQHQLEKSGIDSPDGLASESLKWLEEEFRQMEPRQVIIKGMIANLGEFRELEPKLRRLCDLVKEMPTS
ncbi:TetR/AcrR family transcriptional regulator [Paenibacillus larvae]